MNNTFTWSPDELYHHGIKGQKWGYRRYQNPDGSLTAAGKQRYREDYKKGDLVTKSLTKQAYYNEKKSSKNIQRYNKIVEKHGGEETARAAKKIAKAKSLVETSSFKHAMIKTYNSMTDKDRKTIKRGIMAARAFRTYPMGGAIGGLISGAASYSATKNWVAETEKRINRKAPKAVYADLMYL